MPLFEVEPPDFAGINDHYERTIAPKLKSLELARSKNLRKGWLIFLGLAAIVVFATYWIITIFPDFDERLVAFTSGGLLFLSYLFGMAGTYSIKETHKQLVVGEMAEFLGYEYDPSGFDRMVEHYRDLGILPKSERFSTEDALTGRIGDISFRLTEAKLEESYQGKNGKKWRVVFRGVLVSLTFLKPFDGRTVLKRDGGAVMNFLSSLLPELDRVKLDDPVFESVFDVYGKDQVESRYLLTPSMMERLTELSRTTDRLTAAFDEGEMHVAHWASDFLEAGDIYADLESPALVRQVVKELSMVTGLAETLSLNRTTRV